MRLTEVQERTLDGLLDPDGVHDAPRLTAEGSRVLQLLAGKGMVKFEFQDPWTWADAHRARQKKWTLTAAGREAVRKLRARQEGVGRESTG